MTRSFFSKLGFGLLSLLGLVVLVFFLARLTGDPSALYLPVDATPDARQEFARLHGFDEPLLMQFGHFLIQAIHLDFGQSLRMPEPAIQLVWDAFPVTLMLALCAMLVAMVTAIIVGALAAARPQGVFDRVSNLLSLIGAAAPNFWIALIGVLVFAVWLDVLPTSGIGGPRYWVLPIAVLALRPLGLLTQVVRGAMMTALSSAYVKTARAKGVRSRAIVFVHALRNALLPVITVAGDQAAGMINGAVVIETVFGFPGIGKLLIDSITYRDFAVLQAAVLITAVAILVMNQLIDLLYGVLDPRTRTPH